MYRIDSDAAGRAASVPPRVTAVSASGTRQNAQEREQTAFYELDRWSKYNDPLLVIGFLVVVVSVALIWPPDTLPFGGILLGAGMMKLAWMMGHGK
jgi:hypothetical protein